MNDEKIIQIAVDGEPDIPDYIYALSNTGRIFLGNMLGQWKEVISPIEKEKNDRPENA